MTATDSAIHALGIERDSALGEVETLKATIAALKDANASLKESVEILEERNARLNSELDAVYASHAAETARRKAAEEQVARWAEASR